MGALVSGDVTYTVVKRKKLEDGRKIVQLALAFGDGAKTYPAGGVPLVLASLGCPSAVDSFVVDDKGGSAYGVSYVKSSNKLMMFASGPHTHDVLLKDAAQADGATTRVNAATNKLGANTGSDITVAGAGANGGVVNANASQPSYQELASSAAPAAQTFKVTVIGY